MKRRARRKLPLVINMGNSSPKTSNILASVKINQNYQEILRVRPNRFPVDIRTALAGGIEFMAFLLLQSGNSEI